MDKHARYALAHPVFDPDRQITMGHFWAYNFRVTAGLTVNIGMG